MTGQRVYFSDIPWAADLTGIAVQKIPAALIVCLVLSTQNFALAEDPKKEVTVSTQYFQRLAEQLRKNWKTSSKFDDTVVIDFVVDSQGNITKVKAKPKAPEESRQAGEELIKSLAKVEAPYPVMRPPIGLSANLNNQVEKISVAYCDPDFGPYMSSIVRALAKTWSAPPGYETHLPIVTFKIARDGKASEIKLSKTCGDPVADEAALKAVREATPFNATPIGSPEFVDIEFGFDYRQLLNWRR